MRRNRSHMCIICSCNIRWYIYIYIYIYYVYILHHDNIIMSSNHLSIVLSNQIFGNKYILRMPHLSRFPCCTNFVFIALLHINRQENIWNVVHIIEISIGRCKITKFTQWLVLRLVLFMWVVSGQILCFCKYTNCKLRDGQILVWLKPAHIVYWSGPLIY